MRHFTSIGKKITFALAALSGAALLLSGALILTYEWYDGRATMMRDLTILTEVMAINTTAALAFADEGAAQETLAAFGADESVVAAQLVTPEGALFAEYVGASETDPPSPLALGSGHSFVGRYLHVARPVLVKGHLLGYLRVVSNLQAARERSRRFASILIATLLGAGLLAYLSARRIQRVIAEPILDLAGVAARISTEKDYSLRAPRRGDDEVATLIDGFNHMLSQIEKRERLLHRHRHELEERVAERTRALVEAKESAERAVQVKNEFLANISHELRTPMHAILSFAQLGFKKIEAGRMDKLPGYFDNIQVSGQRLLKLLNELLDLSKLEAGKMTFEFGEWSLTAVVQNAVDECRSLFSQRHVILHFDASSECKVRIDRDRMIQTVLNVLNNAVKFSPEGGHVWVDVIPHDDRYSIRVRDQGGGIPDEDLDLIFRKFEQSSSTKTGAGGTGLGLAICREIVQAHGGAIYADNHSEGGATFTVDIPRSTAAELDRAPVPGVASKPDREPVGAAT